MVGKQDCARTRLQLDVNWKLTALALAFLPLLVSLGFWQLNRAEQKRDIQQSLSSQQALPALTWQQYQKAMAEGHPVTFRRIRLDGQFDSERSYLIENKTNQGRLGYHLITPFYLTDGSAVLVNRGWLAGTGYRDQLPEISTPTKEQSITGWLVEPSNNPFLQDAPAAVGSWPRLRLALSVATVEEELQRPFLDQQLQLSEESTAALVIDWQPINMSATKHVGYAVQWFSLAIALVLLTLFANSNLAAVLKDGLR